MAGDGLFDDLSGVAELDIVGLEEIDVVGLQAGERLFDAGGDAGGGEVKFVRAVAAALVARMTCGRRPTRASPRRVSARVRP